VPSELRHPVARVALRLRRVDRATMPEAPVDEDRHLPPSERDVGTRTADREDTVVDAESQPSRMEKSADCDLRLGVPPTIGEHRLAHAVGARPGHGDEATWFGAYREAEDRWWEAHRP